MGDMKSESIEGDAIWKERLTVESSVDRELKETR
jgi:hypothetical protein